MKSILKTCIISTKETMGVKGKGRGCEQGNKEGGVEKNWVGIFFQRVYVCL